MNKFQENHEEHDQILRKSSLQRHKIIRNKLIAITALNFSCLLGLIVAFIICNWVQFQIDIYKSPQIYVTETFTFTLLSLMKDKKQFFLYGSKQLICQEDVFCQQTVNALFYLGVITILIMALAIFMHVYDCLRMVMLLLWENIYKERRQSFRHILTLLTYYLSIFVILAGILYQKFNYYRFCVSFWAYLLFVIGYTLVLYSQHQIIRNITKQLLILELIEGEKKIRTEHLLQNFKKRISAELAGSQPEVTL